MTLSARNILCRSLALTLCTVALSCGSASSPTSATPGTGGSSAATWPPFPTAVAVWLNGNIPTLAPRDSAGISATVIRSDGGYDSLSTSDLSWNSSNPAVATVTASGAVQALAVGTTTITGSYKGLSDSVPINVEIRSYPALILSPTSVGTLTAPGSTTLRAFYVLKEFTNGDQVESLAQWTSSNPQVATVAGGRITGVGFGSAEIRGTFNGVSARTIVFVRNAVDSIFYIGGSLSNSAAGALTVQSGRVVYNLVTAPAGMIRYVVTDQSGRVISPTPEVTAAVPATPSPVNLSYSFTIPVSATQLCGRWMLVPDGGSPKFADETCFTVRASP